MSVPAWPRPRLLGGAEGSLSCPWAQGRPLRQHPGLPSLCSPGLCRQPSARPAGQSETGARGWPRRLPALALGPAAPAELTPGRVWVCGPGVGPRAQEGRDGGAVHGGVPAHARPGRPAARRQVAAPLSPRTAAHWPRRERPVWLSSLARFLGAGLAQPHASRTPHRPSRAPPGRTALTQASGSASRWPGAGAQH